MATSDMITSEVPATHMVTTPVTLQRQLLATIISFLLAVIAIITTTVVFFPKSRPVIKGIIAPINRVFARSVGWFFVALLWPWIWLLNYFHPHEVPYIQEHLHGINTSKPTVTPTVNRAAIADLRAWRQKSFDRGEQEAHPSVFSDDEDEGE
jgi:hypothetical protein